MTGRMRCRDGTTIHINLQYKWNVWICVAGREQRQDDLLPRRDGCYVDGTELVAGTRWLLIDGKTAAVLAGRGDYLNYEIFVFCTALPPRLTAYTAFPRGAVLPDDGGWVGSLHEILGAHQRSSSVSATRPVTCAWFHAAHASRK